MTGIPSDEPIDRLAANFEAYGTNGRAPCFVKKIVQAFRIEAFVEKSAKVADLKHKLKKQELLEHRDRQSAKDAPKKKLNPKDYSQEFQQKYASLVEENRLLGEVKRKTLEHRERYGLGLHFITFATKQQADLVEEVWGTQFHFNLRSLLKLVSNKHYTYERHGQVRKVPIKVVRAPNPNDITWANLGYPPGLAVCRRLLTFFATATLLGLSFLCVVGLKVMQFDMNKKLKETSSLSVGSLKFRLLSVAITLIIMSINFLLSSLLQKLTLLEKHTTETSFFQSLTIKIVLSQFLNTNVMVVLIHSMVFKPVQAIYSKGTLRSPGALLGDVWFILISQATLGPLLLLLNPYSLFRAYSRRALAEKIRSGAAQQVIQEETQKAFEKEDFDPSFAYASICNMLFTMVFFQPLLPIGSIFCLLSLGLSYYAYKKKLLRDSKRPVMVTDDIAEVTLYLLNFLPFVSGVAAAHSAVAHHIRQDVPLD